MLITFVISIGAIVQPNHVTKPLAVLNWALILDALGVLIVGTLIWWQSLQERNNFANAFDAASSDARLAIQDKVSCYPVGSVDGSNVTCSSYNAVDIGSIMKRPSS